MFEAFFGLRDRPFSAAPRIEAYCPTSSMEAARQTLLRCVERSEGPALVMGPTGCGKSLLCNLLAQHFGDKMIVAHLATPHFRTRRGLLQAILYELGQPYSGMDEGESRLTLIDYLTNSDEAQHGVLLLVDEAQSLPLPLIEEVRMITNLSRDGESHVRLVLCGPPSLEERLAHPRLDSFNQRVAARCYLDYLSRDETVAYIQAQIEACGRDPQEVICDEACAAAYRLTEGVPRMVNQLCDQALVLAFAGEHSPVTAELIEQAWCDLQQIPTSTSMTAGSGEGTAEEAVIEFGELDDISEEISVEMSDDVAVTDVEEVVVSDSVSFDICAELPPESIETLEVVEEQVEMLHEEFEPAGKIEPGFELRFAEPRAGDDDDWHDEEEIVIDAAAGSVLPPWSGAQRVTALDGSLLLERLSPIYAEPEGTRLRLAEPEPVAREPIADAAVQVVDPPSDEAAIFDAAPADEDDLLVVVEDEAVAAGRGQAAAEVVHPRQFAQLFARLRGA